MHAQTKCPPVLHINIYWLDKITNGELFKKTDSKNMSLKIKNRRL